VPNSPTTARPTENQLLALLPAEEQRRLRPLLTPVELTQGEVLYDTGAKINYVYFVDQGMISVVSVMEDGATIEVGTFGIEGLAECRRSWASMP
jgi:CRP-like cAMP-binding protein